MKNDVSLDQTPSSDTMKMEYSKYTYPKENKNEKIRKKLKKKLKETKDKSTGISSKVQLPDLLNSLETRIRSQ